MDNKPLSANDTHCKIGEYVLDFVEPSGVNAQICKKLASAISAKKFQSNYKVVLKEKSSEGKRLVFELVVESEDPKNSPYSLDADNSEMFHSIFDWIRTSHDFFWENASLDSESDLAFPIGVTCTLNERNTGKELTL